MSAEYFEQAYFRVRLYSITNRYRTAYLWVRWFASQIWEARADGSNLASVALRPKWAAVSPLVFHDERWTLFVGRYSVGRCALKRGIPFDSTVEGVISFKCADFVLLKECVRKTDVHILPPLPFVRNPFTIEGFSISQ